MGETESLSYRMIDTTARLKSFLEKLEGKEMVAVDLEADSMYHFKEKVCLIQIGAEGAAAVIDPLKVEDLSPLKPLFKDPNVQKIFHGADYDVRSLHRDFGIEIENLFDTQIACRFLGMRETGLESALSNLFDVSLDKKFQKKDWSKRPLPEEMIEYAAKDVLYLIPLAQKLSHRLTEADRLFWVEEECDLLSQVRADTGEGEPLFLKFKGAGRMGARNLAVLEALLQYRMSLAEKKDRPLFKVFSNDSILKITKAKPKNVSRLSSLGAISEKQIRMYGQEIVDTVKDAIEIPEKDLPVYPRKRAPSVSPKVPERVQVIRRWRDAKSRHLDIDPAVICTRSLITAIAVKNPRNLNGLEEIEEIRNWQCRVFGEEILRELKKMGRK